MALTPRLLMDAAASGSNPCWQGDAEGDDDDDGKKYTKVVTNPKTGRKRRIRYGAKGYTIAPGTDKGDRYCARSFGDMKSEGYDCSGAERNTPLCLSRAKWRCSGKTSRRSDALTPLTVLGLAHLDAPEPDKGKPCGKSFIPRNAKCTKGTGLLTAANLKTVAKVALGAGLVAGGVAIARKWNAGDDRGLQEALNTGKKWDVYEQKRIEDALDPEVAELRAQRQARQERFCGRTDSGKTPAERSDAFKACARQVGEQSAYGQLYVHPDGKSLFKVPTGTANGAITQQEAIDASRNEFNHLLAARQAGVTVPAPISIHSSTAVLRMEYIPDSTTIRTYNKANHPPVSQHTIANSLLDETRRMHRAGIVHSDLHPGNILITPSKQLHIIDFGLAQSLKYSDRTETLSALKDELSTVITRVTRINKIPADKFEMQNWLDNKHTSFLNSLERGTTTNNELTTGIDSWYNDLRKLLNYKLQNPNTIIRLNTVI
jgi:Kae1-associated kinase Bud32